MDDSTLPTMPHVVERSNLTLKPSGQKGVTGFTYAHYVRDWARVPAEEKRRVLTTFKSFIELASPGITFKVTEHKEGPAATGTGTYSQVALLSVWMSLDDARNFAALNFMEGRSISILTRVIQRQLNLMDKVQSTLQSAEGEA